MMTGSLKWLHCDVDWNVIEYSFKSIFLFYRCCLYGLFSYYFAYCRDSRVCEAQDVCFNWGVIGEWLSRIVTCSEQMCLRLCHSKLALSLSCTTGRKPQLFPIDGTIIWKNFDRCYGLKSTYHDSVFVHVYCRVALHLGKLHLYAAMLHAFASCLK